MSGSTARENTAGSDARARGVSHPARRARVIVALGLAAVVAAGVWLVVAARRSQPGPRRSRGPRLLTVDRPFPPGGRFPSDPYVGSRACAECHPGESALHARSGHAATLRPAGRLPLARRLDQTTVADPEWPEVRWGYRYRDGQLHIARTDRGKLEECIAEYAFGSGHHATTFVSVIDPGIPAILEHRLTYYTHRDALGITPGQVAYPPPPGLTLRGLVLPPEDARRCFHCHTTATSSRDRQGIDEATMIPDVACERCHGPGRAHVAAARRGGADAELALPFGPDRWTADSLLTLCGACHRHPSEAGSFVIRPEETHLIRFQPVGLMQSKCYKESGGAFSCVTCHDPHARASADRPAYDRVCLTCHGGEASTAAPAGAMTEPASPVRTAGTPCPVSPRTRCVECHMPRVDAGQFILFSDHWIRVRRPGEPSPGPGNPAWERAIFATPAP
jgi:hypothetical protein